MCARPDKFYIEEYGHLLLDIQSWSLGCKERDKTQDQSGANDENLAHMEVDNYLRDLSTTMMEVDSNTKVTRGGCAVCLVLTMRGGVVRL